MDQPNQVQRTMDYWPGNRLRFTSNDSHLYGSANYNRHCQSKRKQAQQGLWVGTLLVSNTKMIEAIIWICWLWQLRLWCVRSVAYRGL